MCHNYGVVLDMVAFYFSDVIYTVAFGIYVPNFLVFSCIFLVFYRYLEYGIVKIWLNIGIFRQNKNRFGIWFL